VNFRLTAPKTGFEAAVNLKMIKMQFNEGNVPGKISARV